MSKVDSWTDERVDTCLRLLGAAEEMLMHVASGNGGELSFGSVSDLVRDIGEFRREVDVRVVRSIPAEAMRIICGIDWNLLREQKRWLLNLRPCEQCGLVEGNDEVEGLLNLIDSLQDFAVDRLGKLEVEVFDFDYETRETV